MATNIKLKRSATQGAVPGTSDIELGEIALNTYDGKMYMKKTVSGSSSIVELTGSSAPTSSAFAHSTYKYTASGSQTTFTGSDADSKTLSYTAGQIQVFLNGVLLDAADFTATNGSSVVLGSAASANDILYIISFEGTNPFDYFKYTATDAQTSFSGNDANSESLLYTVGNIAVYLNGVLLDATDYTATSGTSVVLASGASTGDILVIYEFNETGLTDVASDTTPQLGGDLDVVTYDIVSTSNRNIDIIPHGTGNVNLGTDTVAIGTSGENVTITTTGTGDLTLNTNSGSSSGSILIADGANNDITITPNGTGDVIIDGLKYPQADGSSDQVLKTDGNGQLSFTTISSTAITDSDNDTKIQVEESSDEDTIRFDIAGTEQIVLADGVLKPTTDNDIDLGTSSLEFKDAFFDGTVKTDALTVDAGSTLTGAVDANSTLNVSGHVSLDGSANELRFYEGSNYVGFEAPALSGDQIWVLPSADGSSGQVIKTDGSGNLSFADAAATVSGLTDTTISSIASGDYLIYNGSAWVNQAQASNAVISTMTGDNSDTTLSLSRAPLTENAVQVYWDGVYQHKDNWSLSGSTITFDTAPGTGVKVEAVVGSQTNILYGNDVAIDTMTGDNSDTTLALSVTPSNENHVNVYFDGVYQSKSNFSLSGSTITFSTAPPTGVVVEAVSNQAVSVGTATGIAASAITGLSEVTGAGADHVLIYDASGSALKKALVSNLSASLGIGGGSTDGVVIEQGAIKIKNGGSQSYIDFYCESSNAHYARLQAPAHSAFSGNKTITLPATTGTIALTSSDITGNAATATTLATARTIGGTSFDGSANISVALADTATALATARTIHGVSFDGTANIDLTEVVQDTVGNMFSSNTETGIAATYQDGDGTIDLVIGNDVIVNSMIADDAIDSAQIADGAIDTAHIANDQVTGDKLSNDITIANDLTVSGNLVVTGTTTQTGASVTDDNFTGLTNSNSGNSTDFGLYGKYVESSTTKYAGLFFDASTDNTFRLFTDTQTEPASTVNTGATGYAAASLVVNNLTGATGTYSGLVTMGGIEVDQYVTHAGDTNTYMEFGTDTLDLRAGGTKGLTVLPGEVAINQDSADIDFRVESDNNTHALFVKASTDRVGINQSSPSAALHITGSGDTKIIIEDGSDEQSITAHSGGLNYGVVSGDSHTFVIGGTDAAFIDSGSARIKQTALTSSSNSVAWDAKAAANAYHVTTENTTFAAPSNSVEGAIISVEIAQGGTARTIAWNTVFEFAASTAPTVTATANKTDIFTFRYNGSVWQEIGRVQNMAQT